jgi:hypothetical protein
VSARDLHRLLNAYVQPVQVALHCVTPAKLWRAPTASDGPRILTFENPPRIELRRRRADSGHRLDPVHLYVLIGYRIITSSSSQRRVVTVSYQYVISDQQQRELLAFHWHPEGISVERDPHVHIGPGIVNAGAGDLGKVFSNIHIPTGHVPLARVVRMLITEFGVEPNRQDWDAVLSRLVIDA